MFCRWTGLFFNTEAHAFPRFELGKMFFTGWTRKQRDAGGSIVKHETGGSISSGKGAAEGKAEPAAAVKTVVVKAAGEDSPPT